MSPEGNEYKTHHKREARANIDTARPNKAEKMNRVWACNKNEDKT